MRVSAIIPCLDAEAFLGCAIRSLLNQTLPPLEIIVADNGSADASRAIARSFGRPVRLLDVPERGASRARLAGAAAAQGEALMFLDADDLVAPETLAAMSRALEAGEGDVALAPWLRLEPSGAAWVWAPPSCAPRLLGDDDLSAWLRGWYHPPCAVLWRRAAYDRSGGWDPEIGVNDDGDVMMRGLVQGNRLARTATGAGFYRRSGTGSLSAGGQTETGLASRLAVLERIEAMLGEQQQVSRYRAPLAEAMRQVAADCPADAQALAERCRAALARLGDPAPASGRAEGTLPVGAGPPGPDPAAPLPAPTGAPTPYPLVSVVIPAYNRADTIARALESVLAQDYARLEVIVVDDGSTDATQAVVAGFADPRIRLVAQANAGVSAARNRGIAEARGALVAFLDSDDEWLPGKVSAQVALFQRASPRLGLVYTGFASVAADGTATEHPARHRGWIYRDLLARNVVTGCGSTAMFRRAALELAGGFDPALPANEDYDLVLRVARFFEADCVAGPLARYHDAAPVPQAPGSARVSRNAAANRASRRALFARYGTDMQGARVAHLFFIAAAERELYLAGGTLPAALNAAARALRHGPRRPFAWRWALTMFLPRLARRLAAGLGGRASPA